MIINARKQEDIPPIAHQRETNQISLTQFSRSYYDLNFLDDSIENKIKELRKEKGDLSKKIKNIKTGDSDEDNHLYFEIMDSLFEIELQLTPLVEVQIIYAYKDFEVKFVQLLKAAYPEETLSESFKWDRLMAFLKSREIDKNSITKFNEVNQLRLVNNSLKHSSVFKDDLVRQIDEISSTIAQPEELLKFYEKVKSSSVEFLESVKELIYKDLYQFDDQKIDRMAYSIALRMEENDAKKFAEKLLLLYKT